MKKYTGTGQISFKEEIRKMLVFYALVPVILCSIAFLLILTLVWNYSLTKESKSVSNQVACHMEALISNYTEGAKYFTSKIDIVQFSQKQSYAAEISQELYRFLGQQSIRGDFYLLDEYGEQVFATLNHHTSELEWNIIYQMEKKELENLIYMYRQVSENGSFAELQIGTSKMEGDECKGYVIFTIPGDLMHKAFVNAQSSSVVVTNQFHRILLGDTPIFRDEMGKVKAAIREKKGFLSVGGKQYYVSHTSVQGSPFVVYALCEVDLMIHTLLVLFSLIIIIVVSIVIAIYYSSHRVAIEKTKIVDEVVEAFHNAENGDLKTHIYISSNDEFAAIGNSYNTMVDSLRSLMERNRMQAQETSLARIKQLESQLNPHFLFNTLESIRFMICFDRKAANEMILCLSRMLRYSIRNNPHYVTLQEEMENTEDYLKILSYRFGEKFMCHILLPMEHKGVRIPPLLFQPLIENSVKHGFKNQEKLCVDIRTYIVQQQLLIEVHDDGVGMSDERLHEVKAELRNRKNPDNHIGIYNVHQRIQLMYGEGYGLQIESIQGSGTTVKLRLPFRQDGTDVSAD